MNSNEKYMFLCTSISLSDSLVMMIVLCSRHGDDLILLIKIGIAHKERTWSQTTINTFKKFMGEEEGGD